MAHNDNNHGHHITPLSTYLKVAGALFVLTIATVLFHQLHLGVLAAPVAFLIASVKAALVILYFMHLKYDNNINRGIFAAGFIFLTLLFVICALDIWTRLKVVPSL